MELRQYWNVIWKRRWLVLAIMLVATVVSAVMAFTSPRSYGTEIRFITRQEPSPDMPNGTGIAENGTDMIFTFNRYYNWFGSEFLVDDYTQITTSDAFANSVLATMKEQFFAEEVINDLNKQITDATKKGDTPVLRGQEAVDELEDNISKLTMMDVKGAIGSDRRHRLLRLSIETRDPDVAKAIADASATVLADAKMQPIKGDMVDDKGVFSQVDRAGIDNISSNRGSQIINAIIRVIIAGVVALALVFLLEYLDNSVRDERDANRVLELPVLGTIPRT